MPKTFKFSLYIGVGTENRIKGGGYITLSINQGKTLIGPSVYTWPEIDSHFSHLSLQFFFLFLICVLYLCYDHCRKSNKADNVSPPGAQGQYGCNYYAFLLVAL